MALLAVGSAVVCLAGPAPSALSTTPSTWRWDLASGFDSYLYTYSLATTDTTETLSELMVQAGLSGQSASAGRHRWRVRAEASAGTELYRERLEGDYRLVGDDRSERLRLSGRFWGRQYRPATTYTRSSDNAEGRLDVVGTPLAGSSRRLQARAWGALLDYATPSALETDRRDLGAGLAVRSLPTATIQWGVGGRVGQVAYPDSAAIDRDTRSLEVDLDTQALDRRGVRLYHRSERRAVRDASVRPSAWTHWSDLAVAVPAGGGHVVLEAQHESWQYDTTTDVYFDSTRLEGMLGYRWGDLMAATWQLGVAAERFDAADQPETYTQFGLRAGVESWVGDVSGTLSVETGRRVHDDGDVVLDPGTADPALVESIALYTDFTYWKIWLLASWRISGAVDLDLLANYEPESHTEQADDTTLGFGSVRLRWRP